MRKFVCLVGLFAFALPAPAQEGGSKDVSVEYSYVRANPATTGFPTFNADGGSASFAYNPRNGYSFAGELSGYHIGQIGSASVSKDLFTNLFGRSSISTLSAALGRLRRSSLASPITAAAPSARERTIPSPWRSEEAWTFRSGATSRFVSARSMTSGRNSPEVGSSRRSQNNLRVSGGVRWRF